ncbi:increased DNA methylation 1-like [Capsicum galapagoense]
MIEKMAGRSRKQKKQRSSSCSWSSESSYSMSDLHYGAKLPQKKAKKDFLANPITGYLTEDDTNLDSSSMGRSKKRNRPSKKEQYAKLEIVKDEVSSSEDDQDSVVLSKKRPTCGRRKGADKGKKGNENGQRQKRATILSWLIDCDVIQENAEVVVIEGETRKKQGKINKDDILCCCCYNVFTVADFYKHAGGTSSKLYEKIFIAETCSPLLSSMVQAWNLPEERKFRQFNLIETKEDASDTYDDACMICADGGDLMCCDKCSSTYHHEKCLGMKEIPKGSWYCTFCVCKFCGDPAYENDYLLKCSQCDKQYHWECHLAREPVSIDINHTPQGTFCDHICNEIYDKMERHILGVEHELERSYKWALLQNTDDGSGINIEDHYQRTVCHSKLVVARRLMEDCFEQIIDRHTRIDVVKSVVYNCGSNFSRVNFKGFYTAILEKDEEIISAATIRIHGTKLAEMPFIATNKEYRRKGMCKKLLVAIESALCYLKVEKLVIPSVSERIGTWIENYGFRLVSSPLPKEIKMHNTLMFHDSKRLQKHLPSALSRTYRANSRDFFHPN